MNVIEVQFAPSKLTPRDLFKSVMRDTKPKFAFVVSWPEDGGAPTFHSNTEDLPVICFRLMEFVNKAIDGRLVCPSELSVED